MQNTFPNRVFFTIASMTPAQACGQGKERGIENSRASKSLSLVYINAMLYQSIPQMVQGQLSQKDAGSIFAKDDHSWNEFTPVAFLEGWRNATAALRELGVQPEEGVGIIAPSCPQWFQADLAVQTNRGWTVPLFPNLAPDIFQYQCENSNIQILVIRERQKLEPALQERLSRFRHVISINPSPEPLSNEISWDTLLKRGQELRSRGDAWIDEAVAKIQKDDVATIIYTSGSTGIPKGVEISHANLLFQCAGCEVFYPLSPATKDKGLSILPVAHVYERMTIYYYIYSRIPIYFGDDPRNLGALLLEVRPTIMSTVPRIVERLYEKLTLSYRKLHGPKRWIMQLAIAYARKADPAAPKTLSHHIYDRLVYTHMRDALGNCLQQIISGSSSLNPSIHRFLLNIGFPLYEGYGLTECSPVLAACSYKVYRLGTVGQAFPNVELRIGEQGELQARGAGVMVGYHNNPEATAEAYTSDGWFRTGDKGSLDSDGFLSLTGRLKELFKTSTGKYVSPIPIENALTRLPLIEYAVVIAEKRKFASALLFLNHAQAAAYLKKADYDPAKGMASRHIHDRIEHHIKRVNRKLNEWEKIRRWTLIGTALNSESGLLTPTLKIRRHAIDQRFATEIESLYAESEDPQKK